MNKVISLVLSTLSLLVSLFFLFSLLLTSEKSLKFLLNLDQELHVDFVFKDSYWHPYKPSIDIDTLSIKGAKKDIKFLAINTLKVEINMFSLLQGNVIESLYAKDMNLHIYPYSNSNQNNLTDFWSYVSSIKNLRIDTISLTDLDNDLSPLKGELSLMVLESGNSILRFTARNNIGGNLDFRMNSIVGSKSFKDYKAYLKASNFNLNQGLINQFCLDCPTGILDGRVWFTLIDLKLVKFLGEIKFKLNSSLDFVNSINAKIELEDPKNNIFRISSFINEIPENSVPDVFTSLSSQQKLFFIPKVELGKDNLVNEFQHFFGLPRDFKAKGYVNNLFLELHESLQLRADFMNLSLESDRFSISGLEGKLRYTPQSSRLKINSPYLIINLGTLFDDPLILNNLNSELDLKLIDEKVFIPKSTFQATYKQSLIKGHINLFPSPFDDTGDLALKISSNDMDYAEALNLFPNLKFTKFTKGWLQNSISCGSLKEFSFIYRGPIDNKYDDSSSSFQSKGFFKDICLNLIDLDIKDISLISRINNSSFIGEVIDGDLYGSKIEATIRTFKDDNNYRLEVKGNSEGPFSTILKLSNLSQIFEAESDVSGEHNSNFYFVSPMVSNLELLGNNSDLKLRTKIKNGNFKNKKTKLQFSSLYSSLEYDSFNGLKDSFATLKINDIPIKFDITKGYQKGSPNTQLVAEDIFLAKNILSSFDFQKEIKGSSRFKIKLTLPSFIKKQPFIDPEIEVTSKLEGISINLPEPFTKKESSKVDLSLVFKPYLNKPPLLTFKYGDLFRGKFNFQNNTTQGFVIAGKKKQSVSIVDDKILLLGELQKLDLGSLISLGLFEKEGSGNFFVKDLIVQETNLSNLSLSNTRYKSSKTKNGFEYKFVNEDLSGILFLPEANDRNLSFKFDFIRINLTSNGSKDIFLSLYNSVKVEFDVSSKAIFFNGHDYGNWKFSVLPETNQLTIYDIKGTYGKWGLKKSYEGSSYLRIFKNSIGWTSSLKTNIFSGSPEKAIKQIGINPNFELDTLSLDVDLTWNNLPWLFNYNSIRGEIFTNLNGLTIKNSGNLETQNNLLRLVNIFNITDSFEKVTNLDFRKLYKRGFSADSVSGKFLITNKSLLIKEPILLKSGSSQFTWSGEISRDNKGNLDMLNLEVIMTLPLRDYLPAYALVLGGPITAGVVYIAGKAFERNLDKISSGKWTITGNISEPKTEFDGWFEDSS